MATNISSLPTGVQLSTIRVSDFIDHYKILGLDHWATSEEVKEKYRELREEYFKSSPDKYRALQDAYLILVDRQARLQYDTVYRQRIGLPAPSTATTSARIAQQSSLANTETKPAGVRDIVNEIESQLVETKPVKNEVESQVDEEPPVVPERNGDQNWALKHFNPIYKTTYGTQEYWSFIPLPFGRNGAIDRLPKYIGVVAKMARP